MGWNEVRDVQPHAALTAARRGGAAPFFYFVHSFYPVPADNSIVTGTCTYGVDFACAISQENIFAIQFHPEKSQEAGRALLARLISPPAGRQGGWESG